MYNLRIDNNKILYDYDQGVVLNSKTCDEYLKNIGMTSTKNYCGKISLFKNKQLHLDVLNDKDFFMTIINDNPLKLSKDSIKRLLYLFNRLTEDKPINYQMEYLNKYTNKTIKNKILGNTEKFISFHYLDNIIEKLETSFKQNNDIFTLQNLILLKCYRQIEALRRDFNCRIIEDGEQLKNENYFDIKNKLFVLKKFKNDDKHPIGKYNIPNDLVELLIQLKQLKKAFKKFKKPEFLLHDKSGNILHKEKYSFLLSDILHTSQPIVKLRRGKVWEVRKANKGDYKKLIELAKSMKHSTITQLEYYTTHQEDFEKDIIEFINGRINSDNENKIDYHLEHPDFKFSFYLNGNITKIHKNIIIEFMKKQINKLSPDTEITTDDLQKMTKKELMEKYDYLKKSFTKQKMIKIILEKENN